MKNKIQQVLEEIATQAESEGHPTVGWEKGKVFEELVQQKKVLHAVEIGTNIGFSALLIIRNLPPEGRLTTIEIDPHLCEIARKNFKKAQVADRVRIITGDAKEMIKTIDEPIDFLFLDALKEEYLIYLEEAENLLTKGAVVVADNVEIFKYALGDYLEYVKRNPMYQSKTIHVEEVGDALEVTHFLGSHRG